MENVTEMVNQSTQKVTLLETASEAAAFHRKLVRRQCLQSPPCPCMGLLEPMRGRLCLQVKREQTVNGVLMQEQVCGVAQELAIFYALNALSELPAHKRLSPADCRSRKPATLETLGWRDHLEAIQYHVRKLFQVVRRQRPGIVLRSGANS